MVNCMNYGKQMKLIRTYNDIKQKEVAEYLNISVYTYSHYETQDTSIPLKHLIKFCNYFDVSIDYVLGFNENINYKNCNKKMDLKICGKRLLNLRKENKLKQIDIAKILLLDQPTWSIYENGKSLIGLPYLYKLCKLYNISADYLLGRIDKKITFDKNKDK